MNIHLIQNQSQLQNQSPRLLQNQRNQSPCLLQNQSQSPIDIHQVLLPRIVAQLEPIKINSMIEPFLTKVSIIRIKTLSKNAKMPAPTIIMLVSKTPSLAGVTMILKQSLDMDLLTVVKLEDQNATTSMTTSAKEVCSLPTKFFTSMPILLWIDLLIQWEKY